MTDIVLRMKTIPDLTNEKAWGVVYEGANEIERLEKLVYVPGVWRCAKCDFRLIQSNLNASDGTVTARGTPGDKCPNCQSPLWRVTERQERTEALDLVEKQFERTADLLAQLKIAKGHIEHMAAWIGKRKAGYSFEGIGGDMPGIDAAITKATGGPSQCSQSTKLRIWATT